MLHALSSMLAPALAERLTLVFNHVLGAEAAAMDRLRPHAGSSIELQLDGWPALLPPAPPLRWRVTPAGLLEWQAPAEAGSAAAADLVLRVDARNPALLLALAVSGERPAVQVEGSAQLAGDVDWLMHNLRWDVAADLERLFGPVLAQQLHRAGAAVAGGLRTALRGVAAAGEKLRPAR